MSNSFLQILVYSSIVLTWITGMAQSNQVDTFKINRPIILTPDISGLIASIYHFRNDSLSMPDSVLQKYRRVEWVRDSSGEYPWYKDTLSNGWLFCWHEGYTDGYFYIKLYRNYIISGLSHENPNPNSIFYIQPISSQQFEQICRLIMTEKIKNAVIKHYDSLYGRHFIHFALNDKTLGLYTWKEFNDFYGKTSTYDSTMRKAKLQYYKGLYGFLKAVNVYLTNDIPLPPKRNFAYDGVLNGNGGGGIIILENKF